MKKIFINESACIACHLCEVYCQLQHSQAKDIVKAFKRGSPRNSTRLKIEEKRPVAFSIRCQHCDDRPCVYACLTGALSWDPNSGIVDVDEERCVGCWTCILVCPFGAIKQNTHQKKIAKCDLCQGEDIPACVANCPNEALICVETDMLH